jgi:membrane protease YdiL (CAAX protease family)
VVTIITARLALPLQPIDRSRVERDRYAGMVATALGIARAIARSPILVIYIALGVGTMLVEPGHPWWVAIADYAVLLPCYVLVIRWWTRRDRPLIVGVDIRPRRRRTEWFVIGFVAAVLVALSVWFWLHPMAAPDPSAVVQARPPVDPWRVLERLANNALGSTIIILAPTALLCLALRLRPREIGLVPRYLGLGLALVVLGIGFAALTTLVDGRLDVPLFAMPAFALPIYFVHVFINGLPEEILNRGLLMSRLMVVLRSPANAIAVSALLFSALHIPIEMWRRGSSPAWQIVAEHLSSQPTGLIWAYLFYRTRSVWPGILWHTSFTTLGWLFF